MLITQLVILIDNKTDYHTIMREDIVINYET